MAKQSEEYDTQANPPSFVPARERKRPDTGVVPTVKRQQQPIPPTFPTSRTRVRAATGKQQSIESFAPANQTRTPRQSGGSSRITSLAQASSSPRPQVNRIMKPAAGPSGRISGSGRDGSVSKTRRKHHRALTILTIILVAIALTLFGCWNWANSQLDKANWLTDKASTDGTSWLILGSDERDDSGIGGTAQDTPGFRTDTILVLTKPANGSSSLISIPRDSLIKMGNVNMKINAVAQVQGKKALTREVEGITGKKINHVALIKFNGLTKVVDALGGVNLCYDNNVNDWRSGLNWQSGCHTVNGDTALAFSRMRYSDPKGDFGRAERQRQVIGAIMSKAGSADTLKKPSSVQKVAKAALSSIEVDNKTNPATLLSMATAFKSATGKQGISGSVYWSDPNHVVRGVGSTVLLDDSKNIELFNQLAAGTHQSGSVGTLSESVSQ